MCGIEGVDTIHMYHMQHLIVSTCHQHTQTNDTKCDKIVKLPFRCLTPSPYSSHLPLTGTPPKQFPCCHIMPHPPSRMVRTFYFADRQCGLRTEFADRGRSADGNADGRRCALHATVDVGLCLEKEVVAC